MFKIIALAGTALIALSPASGGTGPAFWRKDLLVAGQFGAIEINVSGGRITTADLNGDGWPDMILSSQRGLSVLLNTGGGNFGPPVAVAAPLCGPLIAADLNADGRTDLIAADPCRFSGRILLGRGDGAFSPPREAPGLAGFAAVGDFNRDGRPDIASIGGILLGNGDGAFRAGSRFPPNMQVYDIHVTVADFNNDGNADIVAGPSSAQSELTVYLGRGDGTFQAPISSLGAPTARELNGRATPLIAVDVNRDGFPDVVIGWYLLLGRGDGGFQLPRPYFTPSSEIGRPVPFAAVDFDCDGHVDLAVGSRYLWAVTDQVPIFRGKSDGTFSPPSEYAVGWQPADGAVADFDGDGRPDLATANLASNTVSLLLSGADAGWRKTRAVSAASGTAVLAPGSLATLHVATGVTATAQAGSSLSTRLGGISLEVQDHSGISRLARLFCVTPERIDFLVPEDSSIGEAALALVTGAGSTQVGTMRLEPVAPGVFMMTSYSLTPAAFNVRVDRDGLRSTHALFDCSPLGGCVPLPVVWPVPGFNTSYVTFYATGFRNATTENVKCYFSSSSVSVPVEYAGPEGTIPGLDRITIRISDPSEEFDALRYTDLTQEVVLSIDGILANRALLFFSRQP